MWMQISVNKRSQREKTRTYSGGGHSIWTWCMWMLMGDMDVLVLGHIACAHG